MSQLEPAEIEWLQKRFKGWTESALQPPPSELPKDKAPSDADLAGYNQKVAAYNSNPVRQVLTQLETQYSGIKATKIDPDGELHLEGGNVRDQTLFKRQFKDFKEKMVASATEGKPFSLDGIIKMPNLGADNIPSMLSNPGSIMSMMNPMTWISSIWDAVWNLAKQIPIVDDFSGAVSEMTSGREFSMKNGKMHQAAERMFSYIQNPQERATAVNNLMSEYAAPDEKSPPVSTGTQDATKPATTSASPAATAPATNGASIDSKSKEHVAFNSPVVDIPTGTSVTPTPAFPGAGGANRVLG